VRPDQPQDPGATRGERYATDVGGCHWQAGTRAELLGAALEELAWSGPQRTIAAALRVEAGEYLARYRRRRG